MVCVKRMSGFFVSIFLLCFLSSFASAADVYNNPANEAAAKPSYAGTYMDVTGMLIVQPSSNLTIKGYMTNASNTSNLVSSVNVSANFTFGNGSHQMGYAPDADGSFIFNLTLPNMTSQNGSTFDVYVLSNSTEQHNKTLKIFISNATNVTLAFHGRKPPFSTSVNFTLNVSYFNATNLLANNRPYVEIFRLNGQEDNSFQVYNLSTATNSTGKMQYNITIPSTANGQYMVVVDKGLGTLVFGIQSSIVLTSQQKSTSDEHKATFAVNSTPNLYGLVRYTNGTPYTFNSTSYITAYVTLPNGTAYTENLSATDSTNKPGFFNATFDNANVTGGYKVKIVANIGGATYETQNEFKIRSFAARLEPERSFFREWGGKQIIIPSSTVRFNILAENTSSGALMSGASGGGSGAIDCDLLRFLDIRNLATGANVTYTSNPSFMATPYSPSKNVCTMAIGVPSAVGVYLLRVNVTNPGNSAEIVTAEGIVRVQEIDMMIRAISAQADFMRGEAAFMFTPSENVTFSVRAYNFSSGSSGAELSGSVINNLRPIALRSMTFSGPSGAGYTAWTENSNYFIRNVTEFGSAARRLIITLPSNQTGFHEMEIEALAGNQVITGKAFFEVKYVEAHGGPISAQFQQQGGLGGGQQVGGGGGEMGFSPFVQCNGTVNFMIQAYDIKTRQAAQGVSIAGVREVRNDETGTSYTSDIVLNTNITDSNGQALVSVNFSRTATFLDGHYFMLLNISYKGNQDVAYSGFICQSGRQSSGGGPGGFFGQTGQGINARGNSAPWRVGLEAPVLILLDDARTFNGTQFLSGLLKITGLKSFGKTGGEVTKTASAILSANISSGSASLMIYPANFSLTSWPAGFVNLVANITNATDNIPGHSNGMSGLIGGSPMSPPFVGFEAEAFRMDVSNPPNNVAAGDLVSVILNASTNVSQVAGQNITVTFERFGMFDTTRAVLSSVTLIQDLWNASGNEYNFSLGQSGGVESYNVTFIVPASLKPGHVGVRFMVNNTNGNSGELFRSTTVSALDLKTLSQNEVMMQGYCFDVYDDRDKNGSFGERCMAIPDPTQGGMGPGGAETQPFTYANLRMNLSYLNSSFLALNGSVTNASFTIGSRSGNVCFKTAFNYTTFGFGPMSLTNVAANTFFAMFDNDTSGAYDVLVVNSSNGSLQVIDLTNTNSTHRRLFGQLNMTPFNSSALYISSSMDCPNVRFVNGSTRMDSYGASGYFDAQRLGDFKKGQFWYVPYRVTRGNVPIQGSSVSIPGFANMSFGGKGFANMLDSGYFQTFDGASDENGVAFVKANISASGEYMAIWKVNATIGGAYVEDIAKMQRDEFSFGGGAGSMVTIRSFMAFPQGFGMPPITSATQNVTANISAFDFRGQPLTGANATVIGEVFRWGPPQALEVQMFNSSSGGNVTRELIGSTGSAQLLFTKLGGWREGENVEVMARVTNTSASGTDAEIVHIGMIGFMGGGGMQPAGGGCIPGMPCGGPGPGGEQGGMGGMGGY